jgi:alcohol dehydrogenase class IV
MYQNFITNLGIGQKGYRLFYSENKFKYFIISGKNTYYRSIEKKIKKTKNIKLGHLRINKNRNSLHYIKKKSLELSKKKIDKIIVIGGGSVIDFSKRIFLNLKKKNRFIKLWVFPSTLGTGSEVSISSIIDNKIKKNILVNKNFLPETVIYDNEIIKSIKVENKLLGLMDACAHLLESKTTINSNYYLEFNNTMTLKFFFKKYSYLNIIRNKINFEDFSLISFNGGLAQSNSGSGICHALAHSAEQLTGYQHSKCISFFLLPVIKYFTKYEKELLNKFDSKSINTLKKILIYINKKYDFSKITKHLNSNKIDELINLSLNDPCWRLYKKNIDIKFLKKCLYEKT